MAPRLLDCEHNQILSMILRGIPNDRIANAIPCTPRAVRRARLAHARYGTTRMPSKRTGPNPKITPTMHMALCHRLASEPDMDRHEMIDFISKKFEEEASVTNVTRALDKHNMTLKVMRRVAEQQRFKSILVETPAFLPV